MLRIKKVFYKNNLSKNKSLNTEINCIRVPDRNKIITHFLLSINI